MNLRTSTPVQLPPDDGTSPRRTAATDLGPRDGRALWGVRTRILVWSVGTLAVAITAAVVAVRQVLFVQIDGRIDEALVQEADELRRLAGGRDPATGEPFGPEVDRIFDVFLQRNVPAENETYLTFVGGEPYRRTFREPPYPIGEDEQLTRRWSRLPRPERDSLETPAGTVEYLAVPVRSGSQTRGVFVVAFFRDLEAAEVGPATQAAAVVGLATLLIGSIIAWRVAEGVLRPVRLVTSTARRISEGDLTRRIPVTGRDEVSQLARTFNDMLDKLQEAFEAQRRFVDDAGHELRTPITIIRGHLELLEADPADRRASLALVADELDRMQRFVADLLTLAKAGRPDFLALQPVDLGQLTEELLAKAEALGPRRWRLARAARGVVIADRQRLTQALMQLAQNAVQHTAEDAEIEIGSELRGTEARIWVRDTGEGIAPENVGRIFERFARGDHRRASDGAGLGLSIVRAIAEAHHGRVDVSSDVGVGSTFTLVVPTDPPVDDREAPT